MRILFLSHYFAPEGNAPATRVHAFGKRWAAAGHDVEVITCVPNVPTGVVYDGYENKICQHEVVDGVKVTRVWTWLARNAGTLRRTLNYVSYLHSAFWAGLYRKSPDVLIATSPQMFCGVAGGLLSLCKPCPFVLEIRDIWPESITTVGAVGKTAVKSRGIRALEALERWMYRRADQIVTVGKGYQRRLVERGVPESKIAIVSNGVDLSLFRPAPVDTELRARFGLQGKFVIAYVGTIGMASGLDVVLAAARELASKDPRVTFLLVGDGAERPRLQAQAEQQGLTNVVFTGLLKKAEIPKVLASVDVCLVHLKEAELFQTVMPSKIFEASAMQKPILIGVQGHAEEVVREAEAGLVMRAGNVQDLVGCSVRFAGSPRLCAELGLNAAMRLAPRYDVNLLALEYLQLLERIVAGKERPATGAAPANADS